MGCTLVFDPVPYLLFITVFEFAMTFWVWLVNSFQKARVETSLFQNYILDDTLDNKTPNGGYINDNYDDNYEDENILMIIMGIMIVITIMIIIMMIMITILIMIMAIRQQWYSRQSTLTSNFTLLHTSTKVCLIYFSDDFWLNR